MLVNTIVWRACMFIHVYMFACKLWLDVKKRWCGLSCVCVCVEKRSGEYANGLSVRRKDRSVRGWECTTALLWAICDQLKRKLLFFCNIGEEKLYAGGLGVASSVRLETLTTLSAIPLLAISTFDHESWSICLITNNYIVFFLYRLLAVRFLFLLVVSRSYIHIYTHVHVRTCMLFHSLLVLLSAIGATTDRKLHYSLRIA